MAKDDLQRLSFILMNKLASISNVNSGEVLLLGDGRYSNLIIEGGRIKRNLPLQYDENPSEAVDQLLTNERVIGFRILSGNIEGHLREQGKFSVGGQQQTYVRGDRTYQVF